MCQMREFSTRRLTLMYLAALGVVALMSISSHLTLREMLTTHAASASVVNVSGRQRMLSQRIAGLAAEYDRGVPTAREDLVAAVGEFESNRRLLVSGYADGGTGSSDTPALKAIYYEGNHPLNELTLEFIAHVHRLLAMAPGNPALSLEIGALQAAAREPLLTGLNAVVKEHVLESERQLARLKLLQDGILAVVLGTLLAEALGIFRPMIHRIALYATEQARLAITDPLTGALNRRGFQERAKSELDRARRHGEPVAVLMLDIDHFKLVNDTHGHGGGDRVLVALTASLRTLARSSDIVARLGGEEFGMLLPVTHLAEATVVAERIRRHVEGLAVPDDAADIRFTVSIGVAEVDDGATSLQSTFDRADGALYDAKAGGRNCVRAAHPLSVVSPSSTAARASPGRRSGPM